MKKSIFLLSLLTALIAGCYKDKGNYDLSDINVLTLSGSIPDTIRILQMDTLRISAIVDQSIPVSEEKLRYKWSLFTWPNATAAEIVLGTSKDLKVAISSKPEIYALLLKVTETETGVDYFKRFYLQVNSILSEGWMMLEDRPDGHPDAAILTPAGDIFRDIYRGANEGELLPANAGAIRILNSLRIGQSVFILTPDNGIEVDYAGFKKFGEAKDWFFQAPEVIKPEGYIYTKMGVTAFFLNNGFTHIYAFFNEGAPKLGAAQKGNWRISKYMMPNLSSDYMYFYDDLNQRFLSHSSATISGFSNPAGSAWDMNNVGKQLVYAGPGINTFYNCLMKNNYEDKFFVYRVNQGAAVPAAEIYEVLNAPGIATGKFFQSSGLFLHMYYASGNNIYLLDIPAQTARLVYSFPAGAEITAMELKQSPTSLVFPYTEDNRQLVAATYEGGEGKFYSFSIGNTGDFINNSYSKVYTGFGRIRDLEFKYRK